MAKAILRGGGEEVKPTATAILRHIQRHIEKASDETLMMSRRNCHTPGVDSVVLRNEGGRLTRVFMAWRSHWLHRNYPGSTAYEVGIHSHRYDLAIEPVIGSVTNYIYEESAGGEWLDGYEWSPDVAGGRPGFRNVPGSVLRCVIAYELSCHVSMFHWQLHTIHVPPLASAMWLVHEGKQVTDKTRLFTNSPPGDMRGLYGEFDSPRDVRDSVEKWMVQA